MSQPKIVIGVQGGLVQSIHCSEELDDLIVVDWDAKPDSDDVTEIVFDGRSLCAHVTHPIIERFDSLPGSALQAAIDAADRWKSPADLAHEELAEIATGLQRLLYGKQHDDGRWSYQTDKQWRGADVCEAAAELLGRFDLVPNSQGDCERMDGQ